MSTLSEVIPQGRALVDELRVLLFYREQLLPTFAAIEAVTTPARRRCPRRWTCWTAAIRSRRKR